MDSAEEGVFADDLWQALESTGMTLAGISESVGGSGGELQDSLTVIGQAAKYAAPVPLAETLIEDPIHQIHTYQ